MSKPRAEVVLRHGDEIHRVTSAAVVLGRSKLCDLRFDRPGVSRRHCELLVRTDGLTVRDLDSTHGTFVGRSRVEGERRVRAGDAVRLSSKGPRVTIMDARIAGESVLHRTPDGTPGGSPAGAPAPEIATTPAPSRPSRIAEALAAEGPLFTRGLTLGLTTGLGGGLVLMMLIDVRPWVDAVRSALGLG